MTDQYLSRLLKEREQLKADARRTNDEAKWQDLQAHDHEIDEARALLAQMEYNKRIASMWDGFLRVFINKNIDLLDGPKRVYGFTAMMGFINDFRDVLALVKQTDRDYYDRILRPPEKDTGPRPYPGKQPAQTVRV